MDKSELERRIRFVRHAGKEILLVNLSNCSAEEVENLSGAVPEIVTARPVNSVLMLSDLTGASFDKEALRAMKESAVFDKAHVKKSAWIGAESLPREYYESLKNFSRREFPRFKTQEEALAWLVGD